VKVRGGRLDKADVNAALDVRAILERFGAQYRGNQRERRIAMCPVCRDQKRRGNESVVVNFDSGEWFHHGGTPQCRGSDKLALVAAFAGLDTSREFPRVLELAAQLAGISTDTDPGELARMRAAHDAAREARDRRAAEERARGEVMVPSLWAALSTRHPRGERYLAGRGLAPAALRSRGDMVRYYSDGSPAVLLHDLDTGRPINIVRRQIDGKPSKVLSLSLARVLRCDDVAGGFSTEGTLIGRVSDIDPEGADVAILTEGVTDSLAALLAFPTCVVIGANGCDMMPAVASAVAPRLVAARGCLLITVDDDEQGVEGAGDAMRAAVDAGLVLRKSVRAIELGAHHDLADAWRAGWRWTWPDMAGKPGGAA
jgi:hypothetical protein